MLNNYTNYIQELNLLSYDVFHECDPTKPVFFDVAGIHGETFGYGKHAFTISYMDPDPTLWPRSVMEPGFKDLYFKAQTKILFEVLDSQNNVVYSGLTDFNHINGSAMGFIDIQEDLLDDYYEVANGPAKLVLVGELDGPTLPEKWKGTYNIRTQIPFVIRKNQPNESEVIFESQPTATVSQSVESIKPGTAIKGVHNDDGIHNRRQIHTHEIDNLQTYSGEVKYIDVSYRLSGSAVNADQYQNLNTFHITSSVELLTEEVSKSIGNIPIGGGTINNNNEFNVSANTWVTTGTISIDNKLSFTKGAIMTNSWDLSGDMSIQKVIRRTVDDERFSIKINYSGSGGYAIMTSPSMSHLESATLSDLNNNNPLDENQFADVVLHETFGAGPKESLFTSSRYQFHQWERVGPKIHGDIKPGMEGKYDQWSFIVPGGNYFALRLISTPYSTASFNDITITQMPQQGDNQNTFYYKTEVPYFRQAADTIEYRYKFLNNKYETVKDYTKYPVEDVVATASIYTAQRGEAIHRYEGMYDAPATALRVRRTAWAKDEQDAHAIKGEAVVSGTLAAITFPSFPYGVHGVVARARVADSCSYRWPTSGLYVSTMTTGDTLNGENNYSWNTGSAYSAIFTGDAGAGDVIIKQRLGIGSFTTNNNDGPPYFDHPSASLHVKGDAWIEGDLTAENYIVSSSITYMTTSFSSGSTTFGDTGDDTHIFTGSIFGSSSTHESMRPNTSTDYLTIGSHTYHKKSLVLSSSAGIYWHMPDFQSTTRHPDSSSDGNMQAIVTSIGDSTNEHVMTFGSNRGIIGINRHPTDMHHFQTSASLQHMILTGSLTNGNQPCLLVGDSKAHEALTIRGGISASNDVNIGTSSLHQHRFTGSLDVQGDISGSGLVYAKTLRPESFAALKYNSNDDEWNYIAVGVQYEPTIAASWNTVPIYTLTKTIMCNAAIKKLKVTFFNPISNVTDVTMRLRKYDGSGNVEDDSNWATVGTSWQLTTSDISDSDRFYHAPSDWTLSAGEIYGLQMNVDETGGVPFVQMHGSMIIEEDWNNQVSS